MLGRIDGMIVENEEAMRASMRNVETVTATLAKNSQRLDAVMAGLETTLAENFLARLDRRQHGSEVLDRVMAERPRHVNNERRAPPLATTADGLSRPSSAAVNSRSVAACVA